MEKIYMKINGLSPLLMNNPSNLGKEGPIPIPEEEAKRSRYVDEKERLMIPSVALRKSIILGASGYKIGKFSLKSRLSASIQILEEFFHITDEHGKIRKDYEIDGRRVVIRANKAAVIRHRARINLPWMFEAIYGFNSELLQDRHGQVQLESLRKAVNLAGQVAGLLDYRPNRDGWFGKYELVELKIIE